MQDSTASPEASPEQDGLRPPSLWQTLSEVRVVLEWVNGAVRLRGLRRAAPHGSGQVVMVVPGIGTSDRWTRRLRAFLNAIGYRAHGWGLGRNHGQVVQLLPKLVERTERLAEEAGGPVKLIGWSLGGILCREVARERPDLVERVITLGSPVVGGPAYTATAGLYRRQGHDLERIREAVVKRERIPITVPIDAVYTRGDGVVAWQACIDRYANPVEHHEVAASHFGLIVAPGPLRMIAELVARPDPGSS